MNTVVLAMLVPPGREPDQRERLAEDADPVAHADVELVGGLAVQDRLAGAGWAAGDQPPGAAVAGGGLVADHVAGGLAGG
jgi:hypothetical protein